MRKEDAIRVITECAKQYHANLENKNLLFMFGSLQAPEYFESVFLPKHFLHLTGIELTLKKIGSVEFYDRCLSKRLRLSDFSIPAGGMAEMKLAVLPQLMGIYKAAKMIGDYDYTKSFLYTEKLAGNVTACMGFIRDNRYYIPNTALKTDIRDVTKHPQKRILAIYRKSLKEPIYTELCYVAKGIDLSNVAMPENVQSVSQDTVSPRSEKKPSIREDLKAIQAVRQSDIPNHENPTRHDNIER